MGDVPAEIKFISGFLQRAKELDGKDPVVSYYASYYAARQAIESAPKQKQSQDFLVTLLDKLEKDKAAMMDNEAITNELVGYAHVENFALRVFSMADNEDRAGAATNKTAKTFHAAATFLEILKIFGDELDEDVLLRIATNKIQQKIKYAKFKAVDILKAIKEGRQPTPGPPGGEDEVGEDPGQDIGHPPEFVPLESTEDPKPPTYVAPTPAPVAAPVKSSPATSAPVKAAAPASKPIPTMQSLEKDYSNFDEKKLAVMTKAGKLAKFAQSALQYEDVKTAIANLTEALELLKPLQ